MTLRIGTARLDRNCRILTADALLARFQSDAGGQPDGPIVVPQIAALAHMALRRDRPLSRRIVLADAEGTYFAALEVAPDASGVAVTLRDLAPVDLPETIPASEERVPLDGWLWECDAQLRLVALRQVGNAPSLPRAAWAGQSLSRVFSFRPDEEGQFPILIALAEREAFREQTASLLLPGHGDQVVVLSGRPRLDATGALRGFVGEAESDIAAPPPPAPPPSTLPVLPGTDVQFARRIDGALRGPLTRIIATAETISEQLEGPIRDDYARYATDIAEAGRHLLGLVDDLADLNAIERPGFTAAREAVDLADLARRAAGLLSVKADERRLRVETPGEGVVVCATAEFRRVLQVLLNLIGNAIAYSPEGSTIRLTAETVGERAQVTVADEGPGIAPEDQKRIFDKFERLGRSDGVGSGLGLFISQRLAHAMDGAILVDSTPGEGARFTLYLPARAPKTRGGRTECT